MRFSVEVDYGDPEGLPGIMEIERDSGTGARRFEVELDSLEQLIQFLRTSRKKRWWGCPGTDHWVTLVDEEPPRLIIPTHGPLR